MIITRTPLRISFVGGGSDLPAFYREEAGAVVSAAIDKYVYVTLSPKFDGSIRAAYSTTENVEMVNDLQHDLIRETLARGGIQNGVEIHSIADIPCGTGLGSSSAFTVGLVNALGQHKRGYSLQKTQKSREWLAQQACEIEINRCHHRQAGPLRGGVRWAEPLSLPAG
jgi:D-glycero-alpha-D-manno-heptose-7-phosphate kinase